VSCRRPQWYLHSTSMEGHGLQVKLQLQQQQQALLAQLLVSPAQAAAVAPCCHQLPSHLPGLLFGKLLLQHHHQQQQLLRRPPQQQLAAASSRRHPQQPLSTTPTCPPSRRC